MAANVRLVAELGGVGAERMDDIVGQGANALVATGSTCSSRHEDDDLHEVVVEDLRRAGVDQQQ